jgi:hypothetical protein
MRSVLGRRDGSMGLENLPAEVVAVIERAAVSEFATVSAAGVPIDTPTYCFPSDDLATIDVATGLSYPAKAERARRNPKVGLLIEEGPNDPVVSICGHAAVRDADLQGNAERYVAETGFDKVAFGLPWATVREAVWYWTRIIVTVAPVRVRWWPNMATMDGPPQVWDAPADASFATSDPAPQGKVSPAAQWAQRSWQEIAGEAMAHGAPGHLTLCDADGYPLPLRASSIALEGDRFLLTVPRGAPWPRSGPATLTFQGVQTFVGEAHLDGGTGWLQVERALPQHPLVQNPTEVISPTPEVRAKLMMRLEEEARRRGQPIPRLGDEPVLTRLAKRREERRTSLSLG